MFNTDSRADQRHNKANAAHEKPYVHWIAGPSQKISWRDKQEAAMFPATDSSANPQAPRLVRGFSEHPSPAADERDFRFSVAWARVGLVLLLCAAVAFGIWARYEVDQAIAQISKTTTWLQPEATVRNDLLRPASAGNNPQPEFIPVTFTRTRPAMIEPQVELAPQFGDEAPRNRPDVDMSEIVEAIAAHWNRLNAARKSLAARDSRPDQLAGENTSTRVVAAASEPTVFEYSRDEKKPGFVDYVKRLVTNSSASK